MKIALIITNLRGGGAEKALLQTALALRSHGHDARLVLLEDLRQHAVPDELPVYALGRPQAAISKGWLGKRLAAWRLRRRLAQLATDRPFDLLLSTLPFADEVCRLAALPRHWMRIANTLSREIDGLRATAPRKAARRLARYRQLYSGQNLIAVSRGVANDLPRNLGIQPGRIQVVPNPFDLERIRQLAKEETPGLPTQPYGIHVGRFAKQKRHDLLLAAWKQLPAPHLLILLTDPCDELERLIDAQGMKERVRIAGFQTNPYPWIAGAAILVLCSDHEGMPNVLVEALACGTPVVATDCPSGPRELLAAELPEALVPMNDPDALAAGLRRMLARPRTAPLIELSGFAPGATVAALERLSTARPPKEFP
ncbi:MAG: glycosyltransferase [Magnetococcales bacterium]|nr:glycosyltransferase [Magnetococcales bacterium]